MAKLVSRYLFVVACLVININAQAPKTEPKVPGTVTGTILDSVTRRPVGGIRIRLSPSVPGSGYDGTTNSEGRWQLLVPAGAYNLSIIGLPNYSAEVGYPLVNIKESGTFNLPPIFVDPYGWLEGTVLDNAGQPVKDAQVEALGNRPIYFKRVLDINGLGRTDAKGRFRIQVQPGRSFVRVTVPTVNAKGERFLTTFYPEEQSIADATQVYVAPGATVTGMNFRLNRSPTFHVRGRISQGVESPELVSLFLLPCTPGWSDSGPARISLQLREDGSFDAAGIFPGKYCVQYSRRDPSRPAVRAWAEQLVTVTDRDVTVTLSPQPSTDVAGVVTGENNTKVAPPLQVALFPPSDTFLPLIYAQVNGSTTGAFQLAGVFETDYYLAIRPSPGTYVKSIKRANRDLADAHFTPGEFGVLVIEMAASQNRVRGQVKADSLRTLGYQITVFPADRPQRQDNQYNATATPDGEFELSGLAPGKYNFYAWERFDAGMADPKFIERFSPTVLTVEKSGDYKIELKLITPQEISQARTQPKL